jgi:hypothetical protein
MQEKRIQISIRINIKFLHSTVEIINNINTERVDRMWSCFDSS